MSISAFWKRVAVVVITLVVFASPTAIAQDFESAKTGNWHQWRGPHADGVATQGNPPMVWGKQTNIKWKIPIPGEGSSTPIIWNDQIFILSAIETDRKPASTQQQHVEARTKPPENIVEFVVWSIDRNTGKVQWKKNLVEAAPFEGRHPTTTYAASSPVTDGEHLYVLFGSYGVFCLTMKGDVVWERDLGDMRTRRGWGEAVSPALHDGKLVVMWDQEEQSRIFTLDAKTGKTIWQKERDEPTTWATPLITRVGSIDQLVTNGTTAVRSYNLETGDIVWQSRGTTLNAIPCPVRFQDSVIAMAGYRGNHAISIDLNSSGTIKAGTGDNINWELQQHTPYVPSPLVLGKRLYFTKHLAAILSCVDAETGNPIFELTRLPGMERMYASPVAVDDRIYLTSREGTTLVIKASDQFEVLATNRLEEEIDASPAIVGNQIFLRGKQHLFCIESSE